MRQFFLLIYFVSSVFTCLLLPEMSAKESALEAVRLGEKLLTPCAKDMPITISNNQIFNIIWYKYEISNS